MLLSFLRSIGFYEIAFESIRSNFTVCILMHIPAVYVCIYIKVNS